MKSTVVRTLVSLALVAAAAACEESSPTQPTAPETVTDNFTGTLNQGGAMTHPFTVRVPGGVLITLLTVEPPTGDPPVAPALGLAIGTWNGDTCARLATNDNARPGSFLSGSALAGDFCVAVYDTGNITEETTYSLQVIHP